MTEQEIVRGLPGYNGSSDPTSVPLSPGSDGSQAITFIRDFAGGGSKVLGAPLRHIEQEPRLDALKHRIRRVLPSECIFTASARFGEDDRHAEAYLAGFASAIQSMLEAAVDRHIALVSAIERAPDFALQSIRAEHRAFAGQKRKIFVGRQNNLGAIGKYIAGGSNRPLILYGRSGLGKSALIARAIRDTELTGRAPVIYRFVGASATAGSLTAESFAPTSLAGETAGCDFAGFSALFLAADFASASLDGPGLICRILSFSTST